MHFFQMISPSFSPDTVSHTYGEETRRTEKLLFVRLSVCIVRVGGDERRTRCEGLTGMRCTDGFLKASFQREQRDTLYRSRVVFGLRCVFVGAAFAPNIPGVDKEMNCIPSRGTTQ